MNLTQNDYGSKFIKRCDESKNVSALIYGAGSYIRNLDSVIYDHNNVLAIVDQSKVGYYGYVPIIKVEQIQQYDYDKIIIMIKNEKICCEVENMLIEQYGVPVEKIKFGKDIWGK